MRLAGAWLAAGALCAALGTTGRAHAHGSHGKVIRGVVTYQRLCASCHGASGQGDGPRAADALSRPVDLTTIAERYGGFDRRTVAGWIAGAASAAAHGDPEQPVWKDPALRFQPNGEIPLRLDELLDYLEHLQGRGDGVK